MPSKSCGQTDEGRQSTQVGGPTKVYVCKRVWITRIQPTLKSFRVKTGNISALQARSNVLRTEQLKIAVRVHQHVWRHKRTCVGEIVECRATRSR